MSLFRNLKLWTFIHKWTSLVCTVFLLVLCVTGLPLVFSEEIDQWLDGPQYADLPAGTPMASLDAMLKESQRRNPGMRPTFMFVDDDEPQVIVSLTRSWEEMRDHPENSRFVQFDARTGEVLKESDPPGQKRMSVMEFINHLHTDLFVELPGELFLGFMGLLFVAAIVSGVVLYGPFMKKLDFGTVRAGRSRRLKWLDLHNLLGIVALAWTFVVGATGVMNELSTPLFALWQRTEVGAMLAPYRGAAGTVAPGEEASPQQVFDAAVQAVPGRQVLSMLFPGNPFGSPYHYFVWTKGKTPLTSQLFNPLLVDARTAHPAALLDMPWYLRVLELSRPLHFGNYGGLPLKILWSVFDLVTIVVLGSGLYLWFARRKTLDARLHKLAHAGPAAPSTPTQRIVT